MPDKTTVILAVLKRLPNWAVLVLTFAFAGGVGFWYTRNPQQEIITLREANAALQAEVEEYNRHIGETAEATATLMDDARGKLQTLRYGDGCLAIVRTTPNGLRSKLIVDLARDATKPHARVWSPVEVLSAAGGRCLNPHPGPFQWHYGAKNGCWVEVWRQWPATRDHPGVCEHVQMFNACNGGWDSNVRWTQCVH